MIEPQKGLNKSQDIKAKLKKGVKKEGTSLTGNRLQKSHKKREKGEKNRKSLFTKEIQRRRKRKRKRKRDH